MSASEQPGYSESRTADAGTFSWMQATLLIAPDQSAAISYLETLPPPTLLTKMQPEAEWAEPAGSDRWRTSEAAAAIVRDLIA